MIRLIVALAVIFGAVLTISPSNDSSSITSPVDQENVTESWTEEVTDIITEVISTPDKLGKKVIFISRISIVGFVAAPIHKL